MERSPRSGRPKGKMYFVKLPKHSGGAIGTILFWLATRWRTLSSVTSYTIHVGVLCFQNVVRLCDTGAKCDLIDSRNKIMVFDVSLTVHLSITLANDQLDAQIFNTFITILYVHMFRAISCSSSGGQIVLIQHLVSSLSVSDRSVHRLRENWNSFPVFSQKSRQTIYTKLTHSQQLCLKYTYAEFCTRIE